MTSMYPVCRFQPHRLFDRLPLKFNHPEIDSHMFRPLTRIAAAVVASASLAGPALAQDLIINFDDLNPGPKQGFEDAVAKFQEANPDMEIEVNITDREAHKTAIRNFLTAEAPDITAWYPGNRMGPFVDAGLFEDISDLWESEGLTESFASIMPTMTRDGKQWGVPYTFYQWGIYYRADILAEYDIEPPQNWEELLAASATLKEADITPFTIGTKNFWTTGGVFDYLNLRINGYDFHNSLTAGEIPYSDPKVMEVFDHWKELIEPGYFIDNHATMSWQDALAPFVKGEAAMYVMGNFAVDAMKNAGLTEEQIGYTPFPTINPDVERAEDAPADALFIPSAAKNKENARKFLAFIAQPKILTEWNKTIGQLPPNANSEVGESKFLQMGFETLSTAAGLAQFYDRDAPAEMAKAGMEGFQEFMVKPDRLDDIIKRLDKVQERSSK